VATRRLGRGDEEEAEQQFRLELKWVRKLREQRLQEVQQRQTVQTEVIDEISVF
jgi:hypothetical protein